MYLEHVNLTVTDIERSIAFYSRLFGFSVRWQGKSSAGLPNAHVGDERSYVALLEVKEAGRFEAKFGDPGMNHFGFVVDDYDAFKQRLSEMGVTINDEADYEPGRRIYFNDPDGFEIEAVSYTSQPTVA